MSVAPEAGDVPVTIGVSYTGGAATYLDGLGSEADPPGTEADGCPDRVEVELSVEVRTEGGALNERFDSVLSMQHRVGELWYRAPLRTLTGSLQVSAPPPAGNEQIVLGPELDFMLRVSELGTSGRLFIIVREFTNGEDTTNVPDDGSPMRWFASWPAIELECPTLHFGAPIDASFDEMHPPSVAERIAAQRVPLTWADGSETTLVVSPAPSTDSGCASDYNNIARWDFEADASVSTADGILGGPRRGVMRLVRLGDRLLADMELSGSSSREELMALMPASTEAAGSDGGYVEFRLSQYFEWPGGALLGSEGQLSVVVTPPPACDAEECDVRIYLADGKVPPSAAAPEPLPRQSASRGLHSNARSAWEIFASAGKSAWRMGSALSVPGLKFDSHASTRRRSFA